VQVTRDNYFSIVIVISSLRF